MQHYDEELIKSEIQEGLKQVDSTFVITEFSTFFAPDTRKLTVLFKAQNENGEIVEVNKQWA